MCRYSAGSLIAAAARALVPGWISNVEMTWEEPSVARFFERLASFSRLILFDKRGTGLSDRDVGFPALEDRMDDVRAVMDAVGSQRAALLGFSEGGNMSMLFAATYPHRTTALLLFGCFAKRAWAPDYPWAPTPEERQDWYRQIEAEWGGPFDVGVLAPSRVDDAFFTSWFGTYLRMGASPKAALTLARTNTEIDGGSQLFRRKIDHLPSLHWPVPAVAQDPELDRGPVLITVEYHIEPGRAPEFARAMDAMRRIRRRDGAISWRLFEDAARPGRWIEMFELESWVEHLRQHERVTEADRVVQESIKAFHVGATVPIVSHLLAPARPTE